MRCHAQKNHDDRRVVDGDNDVAVSGAAHAGSMTTSQDDLSIPRYRYSCIGTGTRGTSEHTQGRRCKSPFRKVSPDVKGAWYVPVSCSAHVVLKDEMQSSRTSLCASNGSDRQSRHGDSRSSITPIISRPLPLQSPPRGFLTMALLVVPCSDRPRAARHRCLSNPKGRWRCVI